MSLVQVGDTLIVEAGRITSIFSNPEQSEQTAITVEQGEGSTTFISPWSFSNVIRGIQGQPPVQDEVVDGEVVEEVESK